MKRMHFLSQLAKMPDLKETEDRSWISIAENLNKYMLEHIWNEKKIYLSCHRCTHNSLVQRYSCTPCFLHVDKFNFSLFFFTISEFIGRNAMSTSQVLNFIRLPVLRCYLYSTRPMSSVSVCASTLWGRTPSKDAEAWFTVALCHMQSLISVKRWKMLVIQNDFTYAFALV